MTAFDDIVSGQRLSVSASLFVVYRRCPQQALSRLAGVYPPTTRASFKGSLAHRIFARHLEEGPIDDADFERVCRREAGSNLSGAMASLRMKPSQFRAITAEIADIYERFRAIPADGFVEAEAPIEVEPVDGVVIRGRVDAVFRQDGDVHIVDWKTGVGLDGAELQLDFYAMAWEMAFGERPCMLEAVSVRTGERLVRTPTDVDVERVRCDVARMVDELRLASAAGRELTRTAGPFCRWCPLLETCSEGATALDLLG
ncbi:MAG: PD-(D/E)XK nuclease family protein [Actinomycetia bacterium]|nr:PD-(D/E)XK nuclease family protein [Actinomycetes bacterium]